MSTLPWIKLENDGQEEIVNTVSHGLRYLPVADEAHTSAAMTALALVTDETHTSAALTAADSVDDAAESVATTLSADLPGDADAQSSATIVVQPADDIAESSAREPDNHTHFSAAGPVPTPADFWSVREPDDHTHSSAAGPVSTDFLQAIL